jgi:hypothetical protein
MTTRSLIALGLVVAWTACGDDSGGVRPNATNYQDAPAGPDGAVDAPPGTIERHQQ